MASSARSVLRLSVCYFALVFGAGFALALIRVPFLAPRLGERAAELIEMPFMLAVIYFAARWLMRRSPAPATPSARLAVGLIALALLLLTEFSVVLWLQGLSIREALAKRDPVSGGAYALSLIAFAVAPLLLGPRPPR